jgi:S-adenosylmethionine-diacylgycerolhomoserine-N-methlytransferase
MGAGGFLEDLRTLYYLTLAPRRGNTHAERLEDFYKPQAASYDRFRDRLLQGRREMLSSIPFHSFPASGVWCDFGAGTGANLEFVKGKFGQMKSIYLVDLCASLLKIAQERVESNGWSNVRVVEADATSFAPSDLHDRPIDLITFSYSLTMIPEWKAVLDNALSLLKPGGMVGIVDFCVSPNHSWVTRTFWPTWFGFDNVFLNSEHLPYLLDKVEPVHLFEGRSRPPYFPIGKVPYYYLVGRKK